jgi:allantoinase
MQTFFNSQRDFAGYQGNPPQVEWPGGAKVAVSLVLNYEEGSELAVGDGDSTHEREGQSGNPISERDMALESMYEYGSRVGFWRIMDIFDDLDVAGSVFACAVALERNRKAARTITDQGHEVVSHGYRWEDVSLLSREEERRHIELAVASLTETTGVRPLGWYCRYGPSVNTRDLIVENGGFVYDSDYYGDDLPFWTTVRDKKHLVVPYSLATNDIKFNSGAFGSPVDFEEYLKFNFDQLYDEAADAPKMMSVGLHMRIAGLPGPAQALHNFIRYAQNRGDVWFARRIDIAQHWIANHR